jgi:extracellular factor (EF) 3-hydroxypalmitic acid methyl ester biosynthesis protein
VGTSQSPFIRRIQTWPRGYPGDFETIQYLFDRRNQAAEHALEYWCEEFALNCPIAQQHRNKIRYQATLIRDAFVNRGARRVLSLGCSSCRDLQSIQHELVGCEGELWLNDVDAGALAGAEEALQPIAALCRSSVGHPIRALRRLEKAGGFDLVVAGGLFDYVPDDHLGFAIQQIYHRLLKPGGRLFFTNVARGNPWRPWMEQLADWMLIERADEEIRAICRAAGVAENSLTLAREETGLTILVEAVKAA